MINSCLQPTVIEREALLRRALAIAEETLGPEHPDTGTSLNNLAGLLQKKGDYDAADPLYRRALAIREKALGPEFRKIQLLTILIP